MIIAQSVTAHPTQADTLRVTFNCLANEATPHFMEFDIVYPYMKQGDTTELDLPASLDIKAGDTVLLSKFVEAYTQQDKNWNLAWSIDELPEPSNLHRNMMPPAILKY